MSRYIPDKDMDTLYSALFALCPTEETQQRLSRINKERHPHSPELRHSNVIQMMSHTLIAMEEMR